MDVTTDKAQPWYKSPLAWGAGAVVLIVVSAAIYRATRTPQEQALRWGWKAGRRGWTVGTDDITECRAELGLSRKRCSSLMRRGQKNGKAKASWAETKRSVLK